MYGDSDIYENIDRTEYFRITVTDYPDYIETGLAFINANRKFQGFAWNRSNGEDDYSIVKDLDDGEWERFCDALRKNRFLEWDDNYRPSSLILDGYDWRAEYTDPYGVIHTGGNNCEPGYLAHLCADLEEILGVPEKMRTSRDRTKKTFDAYDILGCVIKKRGKMPNSKG